jgi:hypothetical protein
LFFSCILFSFLHRSWIAMIILGACLCIAVFRKLRVRQGLQTRVVVLAVHSNFIVGGTLHL